MTNFIQFKFILGLIRLLCQMFVQIYINQRKYSKMLHRVDSKQYCVYMIQLKKFYPTSKPQPNL